MNFWNWELNYSWYKKVGNGKKILENYLGNPSNHWDWGLKQEKMNFKVGWYHTWKIWLDKHTNITTQPGNKTIDLSNKR